MCFWFAREKYRKIKIARFRYNPRGSAQVSYRKNKIESERGTALIGRHAENMFLEKSILNGVSYSRVNLFATKD